MTRPRFTPYAAYKDSGVEWLGEVPVGWKVKRLKRLFRVVNGATPASGEPTYWDGEIPWVTPDDLGNLTGKSIATSRRNITVAGYRGCGTTLVPAGSLVLSTRAPIGHLALASTDLCTNQGCRSLVFRSHACHDFFFYELFAARPELESLGQGSTFRELATGMLEDLELAEPPLPEQRAISTFLDRETARIDTLVAKKERLITLLQERRAALITRAVTKGLDPASPMKDSGVEWLGEIPANWEAARLRRVLTWIQQGWSPDCENREADEDEWGVLKAGCVNGGEFVESEHKALPANESPIPALEIQEGDLLMSRASGSRDLVGSVAVVQACRPRLLLCDKVFRLHVDDVQVSKPFLAHSLNSRVARSQIESVLSGGSGLANNIAQGVVKDLVIAIPPREEQYRIVSFVDSGVARIDALITRIRAAITHLHELRTALISAAVTGKIDVREPAQ